MQGVNELAPSDVEREGFRFCHLLAFVKYVSRFALVCMSEAHPCLGIIKKNSLQFIFEISGHKWRPDVAALQQQIC